MLISGHFDILPDLSNSTWQGQFMSVVVTWCLVLYGEWRCLFDVYIRRPGKTNQNQGLTTEAAVGGFSVQVSELNGARERA